MSHHQDAHQPAPMPMTADEQRQARDLLTGCQALFIGDSATQQQMKAWLDHKALYAALDLFCSCLEHRVHLKPAQEWPDGRECSRLLKRLCRPTVDAALFKIVHGHFGDEEVGSGSSDWEANGSNDVRSGGSDDTPSGLGSGSSVYGTTPPPSHLPFHRRMTGDAHHAQRAAPTNSGAATNAAAAAHLGDAHHHDSSGNVRLKPWKHMTRHHSVSLSRNSSDMITQSPLPLHDALSSDLASIGSLDMAAAAVGEHHSSMDRRKKKSLDHSAADAGLPSPESPLNPYYLIDALAESGSTLSLSSPGTPPTQSPPTAALQHQHQHHHHHHHHEHPTNPALIHLHRPDFMDARATAPSQKYSSFRLAMALFQLYIHSKTHPITTTDDRDMDLTDEAIFALADLLTCRMHPELAVHLFEQALGLTNPNAVTSSNHPSASLLAAAAMNQSDASAHARQRQHDWLLDLRVAKSMIFLYVIKRPSDIASAQWVITEHQRLVGEQQKHHTASDDDNDGGHHDMSSGNALWLYFMSLVRQAKWSDCVDRYDQARVNADTESSSAESSTSKQSGNGKNKHLHHGNSNLHTSMMEVAVTYNEFEYGWLVYTRQLAVPGGQHNHAQHPPTNSNSTLMDRYAVITACILTWKAYFCAIDAEQKMIWEARAWSVVRDHRQLPSERDRAMCVPILRKHLLDIIDDQHVDNAEKRMDKCEQLKRALLADAK